MDTASGYDEKYARDAFYWGTKPSKMCDRVLEFIRPSPGFRPTLLDVGCGEGRNAVYFARLGFRVIGLDLSARGLEKTRRLAEEHGVEVETVQADIVALGIILVVDGEEVLISESLAGMQAQASWTSNSLLVFIAEHHLRTDPYLPEVLECLGERAADIIREEDRVLFARARERHIEA